MGGEINGAFYISGAKAIKERTVCEQNKDENKLVFMNVGGGFYLTQEKKYIKDEVNKILK